jgi:hypothetical protein
MVELSVNPKNHTADFEVAGGCPSCGGDLSVRVSPGHEARSYCKACHWLSRQVVTMEGNKLQLAQPISAQA